MKPEQILKELESDFEKINKRKEKFIEKALKENWTLKKKTKGIFLIKLSEKLSELLQKFFYIESYKTTRNLFQKLGYEVTIIDLFNWHNNEIRDKLCELAVKYRKLYLNFLLFIYDIKEEDKKHLRNLVVNKKNLSIFKIYWDYEPKYYEPCLNCSNQYPTSKTILDNIERCNLCDNDLPLILEDFPNYIKNHTKNHQINKNN